MTASEKARLTLWVDESVKEELKTQARALGVSASALVSVLVKSGAVEKIVPAKADPTGIGGPQDFC